MSFDQSGEKRHTICIDHLCFTVLLWIMIRTHIGNPSILDPDGLFLDKLSGENIEEDAIGDDRIRRDIAQSNFTEDLSFLYFLHTRFHSKNARVVSNTLKSE